MPRTLLLIVPPLLLMILAGAPHTYAQSAECPPAQALLSHEDPAYGDAMALADDLRAHGFVIHCVFPSKLRSIFTVSDGKTLRSTVEGETVYRTNYGDVDVVFMPKPQTWEPFKVSERHLRSGYMYTFAGTPRVWDVNQFGTARRTFFLKRGNQMFVISDTGIRARLEKALDPPPKP